MLPLFSPQNTYAITDPLSVPNNKFGIHIIQATPAESSPAAELVNQNGDWGYITVLIESKDRNFQKWQEFFDDLRRRRLIPIVRLATEVQGDFWKRPEEGEETVWAKFLGSLNWPVKNRYVVIYNEPNHAKEWGNETDGAGYAKTLDQTIDALKKESEDFFVLNAGLDASAPEKPPYYKDALKFMKEMEQAVPGIFQKIDGWASHSYPNPGFTGSPYASGRGTVKTYLWELQALRSFGVTRDLPVFITETGWRHSEGVKTDPSLPTPEQAAGYFKAAFEGAWNDPRIVAVTPFLLSYQEEPFDHFSFKKLNGEKQTVKTPIKTDVLGTEYPEYHPQYYTLKEIPKEKGEPVQTHKTELSKGAIYKAIVAGETYHISLTFKNTGQSTWGEKDPVSLVATEGSEEFKLFPVTLPQETKIYSGQEYTFEVTLKAQNSGNFPILLNLFHGNSEFESSPVKFQTKVESAPILKIKTKLRFKTDHNGKYLLEIAGTRKKTLALTVDKNGNSQEVKTKYLLPQETYTITLTKPFYKPKTIKKKLTQDLNLIDFGTLQPDFLKAIFHPVKLWGLLF